MRWDMSFSEIAQLAKVGQSIRALIPNLDNFDGKQSILLRSTLLEEDGRWIFITNSGACVR